MNVLDLGFFRSIQALQYQKSAYIYSQLVKTVNSAFESLTPNTFKFVWITLPACKIEVIKKLGGIDYHIPHGNMTELAREGRLSNYLGVRKEIIYEALCYLDTKVKKSIFEFILFYVEINDEDFFHQTEEIIIGLTTPATTPPTNQEQQVQQQ